MAKGNLVEQVAALLQSMPDVLSYDVLDARRAEIIRISNLCKKDPLYARTEKARFDFYRPIGAVPREKALLMSWVHFLDRMAKAPSKAHLHGVVVLCFPILGDILKHGKPKQ